MRKRLEILIIIILLLSGVAGYAQSISISSSSTSSICYNDGSITVNASGGSSPYTYSLISGPASPSLAYPITLSPGSNTFSNLPHGSYTIQVTDGSGAMATGSATVGGTYQYPLCTATSAGLSIICNVAGGTGTAPYLFAISHTGPNSGFGPYQSSNTFTGMCPGVYWVRVQDNCGNIYTATVNYTYAISFNLQCVNFSKGTASITAVGGHGPYTYSLSGQTNQTGIFTGLPAYFSGVGSITDSCGVQCLVILSPGYARFAVHCPFDSSIYLSSYIPTPGLSQNGQFTYVCTSCNPVQTTTNSSGPLFQHINYNQAYNIEIISPACGGDTTFTTYVPMPPTSYMQVAFTNCNSFKAQLYGNGVPINPPNVDSFVLQSFPNFTDVSINQSGVFNNVPDGSYYLSAYSSASCTPPAHIVVSVPHLPGSCSYMMKNAACQTLWEFSLDSVSSDHYTMVYTPGDTVAGIRSVNGLHGLVNFYDVTPGTHTLISDRGCIWPLNFDSLPVMGHTAYSSTLCGGAQTIYITDTPQSNCNAILTKIYYKDSLIASVNSPVQMPVTDSGWYHYSFYAISYPGDTSLVKYDTICPLDSGAVYVGYGSLPYPYAGSLYECGTTAPPTYSIYGGQIPYTVEIPGLDTIVLNTNIGTFPTSAPGVYNVIVYDNCGISRSFNFTIVDTCTVVNCGTIKAGNDTSICIGRDVLLTSTVTATGGTYSWSPGTGSAQDTLVSPTATSTYIVSYAQHRCATVSDTITLTVLSAPQVSVNDTTLCIGKSGTLTATASPAGGSYSWSPGGATGSSISISPTANTTYTVTYRTTGCPPAVDSGIVTVTDTPAVSVSTWPAICYSQSGRAAATASGGIPPYSYLWSDVARTTKDTLNGLFPASSYTVTVSDLNYCTASGSGLVGDSMQALDIIQDSLSNVSCYGAHDGYISVHILNSSYASYQWNPASTDSILSGLASGTYSLTATDPAGCRDTISFTITQPQPVSLSITPNDSILEEDDSLSFYTSLIPYPQGTVSYNWSPNIGLSCYDCAQPVFSSTSGEYNYTLVISYNGVCRVSDTVSVKVMSLHHIYVPNAFSPNGDNVNDIYQIYPIGVKYFSLKIFNRWGEKVFESLDAGGGWDGRYKGKMQEPGIYTYMVDVTFNDGYTAHDKGSVTLIR